VKGSPPCLRDNDFSARALVPFKARVESELRYDMALARLIVQLISNRALTPVWIGASKIIAARVHKDANYASIVAGIFAGLSPARDALKVVGGTIDQAARSLAIKAVIMAFSGPRGWADLGVDTAQAGFQLAYDATMDLAGFVEWLKCRDLHDRTRLAGLGERNRGQAERNSCPCSKTYPD
jgi:menaquinone-9 beta-reductase